MTGDGGGANWWRKIRRFATAVRAGLGLRAANAPANGRNDANEVVWIEPSGLAQRLKREIAPIIVDVRGADEFQGELGHLADARNIALPELLGRVEELAPYKDHDLVLVCHTQMRSAQAARLLDAAGFHNVAVLRGGMVEWRRQGLPVAPRPRV